MGSVHPKYIILLVAVAVFAVKFQLANPHKKYSTDNFWQQATVASVAEVPQEALEPGNKNGGVLMWAAMGASDPAIISALVDRGADINESDSFLGTPLSGAAGRGRSPAVVRELVRLGADVEHRVGGGNTSLMIAAMYNSTPGIVEELASHGIDINAKNDLGETALEIARKNENAVAESALVALSSR